MHWKTKRRRTDWRLYQLVFQCMGTNEALMSFDPPQLTEAVAQARWDYCAAGIREKVATVLETNIIGGYFSSHFGYLKS